MIYAAQLRRRRDNKKLPHKLKRYKGVRDETALVETQPQSVLSKNKRIKISGLDKGRMGLACVLSSPQNESM